VGATPSAKIMTLNFKKLQKLQTDVELGFKAPTLKSANVEDITSITTQNLILVQMTDFSEAGAV